MADEPKTAPRRNTPPPIPVLKIEATKERRDATPTPKPSVIKQTTPLPTLDSSLDQFIQKSTEHLLDVSAFDTHGREQELRDRLDKLEKQLAARGPRWTGIAIAFLVGSAAMFVVHATVL